jgi:hypothetical protein
MKLELSNVQIGKVTTLRDRTIKAELLFQEIPTEQKAALFDLSWKEELNTLKLDVIEEDNGKSPSVRQRGVIFKIWENNTDQSEDFETYYRKTMFNIIEQLKEKI